MVWQDVFVDRVLSKSEIIKGLMQMFEVIDSEIAIDKNIYEKDVSEYRIFCATSKTSVLEFPIYLSFYVKDDLYKHSSKNIFEEDKRLFKIFCNVLNCRVLIGDESLNPNSWTAINSIGKIEPYMINEQFEDLKQLDLYE